VSGAGAFDRFGADFLGVRSRSIENEATYYVPAVRQPADCRVQRSMAVHPAHDGARLRSSGDDAAHE